MRSAMSVANFSRPRSQAVVDASVWVGYLISSDVHHSVCVGWLDNYLLDGNRITLPSLALAEIAGAIARRTQTNTAGYEAIDWIEGLPRVRLTNLDGTLARESARIAVDLRLRGADAIYVALAARLSLPLVTCDREMLERAAARTEVRTPDRR